MGGPIDIEQKGCESFIHDYDHDLLVGKVRCKNLVDSVWFDFRCRRAIDSSSLNMFYLGLIFYNRMITLVPKEQLWISI